MQDVVGYVKLVHRLTGAQIVVRGAARARRELAGRRRRAWRCRPRAARRSPATPTWCARSASAATPASRSPSGSSAAERPSRRRPRHRTMHRPPCAMARAAPRARAGRRRHLGQGRARRTRPAPWPARPGARPSTARAAPTRCSPRWSGYRCPRAGRRTGDRRVAVAFPVPATTSAACPAITTTGSSPRSPAWTCAASCAGASGARIFRSCSATTPRRRSSPRPCTAPAGRSTACWGSRWAPAWVRASSPATRSSRRPRAVLPGELYRQPFGAADRRRRLLRPRPARPPRGRRPGKRARRRRGARLRRLRRRPGRLPRAVDRGPARRRRRRRGRDRRRLRAASGRPSRRRCRCRRAPASWAWPPG